MAKKKKRRPQQKVARRRSAVRRYDPKKVALTCAPVLFALVAIGTLTWDIRGYVSESPRFSIETIGVVGNRQLTRAELRKGRASSTCGPAACNVLLKNCRACIPPG